MFLSRLSPVRVDLRKRRSLCGQDMEEKTFRCELSVWFSWNFCEGRGHERDDAAIDR